MPAIKPSWVWTKFCYLFRTCYLYQKVFKGCSSNIAVHLATIHKIVKQEKIPQSQQVASTEFTYNFTTQEEVNNMFGYAPAKQKQLNYTLINYLIAKNIPATCIC